MTKQKMLGLILGPLCFALIMLFLPAGGELTEVGKKVLACMVWMVIWWSTLPVTLGQTALLPILLFPMVGAGKEIVATLNGYVGTASVLTISIFWIGSAIEKWNLHRRIAFTILSTVGTKPLSVMMAFAATTGVISMWMSNTASTAMMIPIVAALALSVAEFDKEYGAKMGAALMLTVAYAATNGGTATPIGNNANIVGIGMIKEMTGVVIDFPGWMMFAVPICFMMVVVCTLVIYYTMDLNKMSVRLSNEVVKQELEKLGPVQHGEKIVLIIMGIAIFCWVTKTMWGHHVPFLSDHIIGSLAAAAMFLWPVDWKTWEPTLDFKYALSHTSWDAVYLIGGSVVIGNAFAKSGLTNWVAAQMGGLSSLPVWGLLIAMAVIASVVTELGSNIVVAAVFIPIAASLTANANNPHVAMLAMINVIFSCGFAYMLPQGTPPDALAIGSGLVDNRQMMKTGTWAKIAILILYPIMFFAFDAAGLVRF